MTLTEDQRCKLNPHLLKFLDTSTFVGQRRVQPEQLVSPARFDLAIKHLYARHRQAMLLDATVNGDGLHVDLYKAHIGAFSRDTFKEDDGSKNCLEDFFTQFHQTLLAIAVNGFDPSVSMVPVGRNLVPLDGSHRVAACLLRNEPVDVLEFDVDAPVYDANVFAFHLGNEDYDLLAVEYAKLTPLARLVTLFPVARGQDERVTEILSEYATIVHSKDVEIYSTNAGYNVIRELYLGEAWLGKPENGYGGAVGKGAGCFAHGTRMRVFLVHAHAADSLIEAKKRIRALWPSLSHDSVHCTDTQPETLRVARALLLDAGIWFINRFQGRYFPQLETKLSTVQALMQQSAQDDELICLDTGAVLAACGLRAPTDIDVLHDPSISIFADGIESHNGYLHLHRRKLYEILFNPRNHFWTRGVKFVHPELVRLMKMQRGEPKDLEDARMIEQFATRC